MEDKRELKSPLNKNSDLDISLEERDILDFNSSSHNNNSGEETNKKSRLEVLAEETFNQTLTDGSQELVDENIRTFLAEESIVERTQDCKKYFADHVELQFK